MYSNSFNPGFYIRAMFLGLPWTTTSSELDQLKYSLVVYPNPSKGELTFESNFNKEFIPKTVYILTLSGTIIFKYDIPTNSESKIKLDLNFLSAGSYLLTITNQKNFTIPTTFQIIR